MTTDLTNRTGRWAKGEAGTPALTALLVRQLKTAGRHANGNGLYLVIDPSGAKRWVLRTVVKRKRRDIGLGGASLGARRAVGHSSCAAPIIGKGRWNG